MSSILGHALVGLAIGELARRKRPECRPRWRWPVLFATVSILPDVDVGVAMLLGVERTGWLNVAGGSDPHRGLTHTLAFAVCAGLVVSLLLGSTTDRARLPFAPWLVLCCTSHLVLDAANSGPPIAFLWPLGDVRWSLPGVLPPAHYSLSLHSLGSALADPFWRWTYYREIYLFLPVLLAAYLLRLRSRQRDGAVVLRARVSWLALASIFAMGLYGGVGWFSHPMRPSWVQVMPNLVALTVAGWLLVRGLRRGGKSVRPARGLALLAPVCLLLIPAADVAAVLEQERFRDERWMLRDLYHNLTWSRDGTLIACARSHAGEGGIYVVHADGSGSRRLFEGAYPSWSPADSRLVYCDSSAGNQEVYVVHADGTGRTRLTFDPANDSNPVWSPDGSRIAYASSDRKVSAVHLVSDGRVQPIRLTRPLRLISDLVWSPDGTRLAFAAHFEGNFELWALEVDGAHLERLTRNPAEDRSPTWSPDGSSLLFSRDGAGGSAVYRVGAGGSGEELWVEGARSPLWSPDGSRVLACDGSSRLCLFDADRPMEPEAIIDRAVSACWSPDGARIAVAVMSPDVGELRSKVIVIGVDGAEAIELMPPQLGTH